MVTDEELLKGFEKCKTLGAIPMVYSNLSILFKVLV